MSALPFHNKTNKTKFEGTFILDSIEYKYTIYLVPIVREVSTKEQNEIIRFFGNRKFQDKICLDVDEDEVRYYLFYNLVSAFIIVQPIGINNIASGTLQIYNRCLATNETQNQSHDHDHDQIQKDISNSDVWINDICRISGQGLENAGQPLKAMFFLIEQLTVQNLGKHNIKLYIERTEVGYTKLKPKYISLGFTNNHDNNPNICPDWKDDELVMEKSNIIPQQNIIDFSFLNIAPYHLRSHKRQRTYGVRYKN